jgi:hypothetical protein
MGWQTAQPQSPLQYAENLPLTPQDINGLKQKFYYSTQLAAFAARFAQE